MASSFTDLPTAEYQVAAAVQANLPALLLWLGNSSRAVQRFDYDAGTKLGYGIVRGSSGIQPMTKLRVILRRIAGRPDTCFVLTAFPIL
jgi:Bacterial CdiA-CT RNAse A domain